VGYSISEDYVPLDNEEGGNQKYDLLLDVSETGIMALHKHGSEQTDIFHIFLTQGRGWESKFLFRIDRVINRMEIDGERVILDHQIYTMKGNLLQTMVRNMNNF
jgi:hypothetical protein